MSKIELHINKNTNYIFHMLSVSKCGYDNDYGDKYKDLHLDNDLKLLNNYDELLTVLGGQHFGKLYSMLVSTPASIETDNIFIEYLLGIKDLFQNGNPYQNYRQYKDVYSVAYLAHQFEVTEKSSIDFYNHFQSLKISIVSICDVLINNYEIYNKKMWHTTKTHLETIADELNLSLQNDLALRWEIILDHKYPFDKFIIILCNSIKGGANAIDIAYNKDVFCSEMSVDNITQMVSHEFGIYILRDLLKKNTEIDIFTNYDVVESVIEYYNPLKEKKLIFSENQQQYYDFIDDRLKHLPSISIENLVRMTKDFGIKNFLCTKKSKTT